MRSIGIPEMPAANKVEAMIPDIHMKLFVGEKVLPGEFSFVSMFVYPYGSEAAYIFLFF